MVNEPTSIDIMGKGTVTAVLSGPDQPGGAKETGVVIAHGAANDMNNCLIVAVADGLAAAGYTTLRFNFLYKEQGKKSPDAEPILIRTWQGAVAHLLNNEQFPVNRVVAAGKSMGGAHFIPDGCRRSVALISDTHLLCFKLSAMIFFRGEALSNN